MQPFEMPVDLMRDAVESRGYVAEHLHPRRAQVRVAQCLGVRIAT